MLELVRRLFRRQKSLYGLDHAVLNVVLPLQSMWMNMGYWEVSGAIEIFCILC